MPIDRTRAHLLTRSAEKRIPALSLRLVCHHDSNLLQIDMRAANGFDNPWLGRGTCAENGYTLQQLCSSLRLTVQQSQPASYQSKSCRGRLRKNWHRRQFAFVKGAAIRLRPRWLILPVSSKWCSEGTRRQFIPCPSLTGR